MTPTPSNHVRSDPDNPAERPGPALDFGEGPHPRGERPSAGGRDARGAETAIPLRPQSWYVACGARELRPGQVRTWSLTGRDIVLFRGRDDRRARALAAPCVHMGTHLGSGTVVGNDLRCPLHHWQFDGDGLCRRIPSADTGDDATRGEVRQTAFPTVERYGAIFVFLGRKPRYDPPGFSRASPEEVRLTAVPPVRLRCPWYAVTSNGFDMQHFQTVHDRALERPPELTRLDADRLRLRYTSSVTGTTLPDRLMKLLSGNRIEVCITCFGGNVVTVESDLGRTRSVMMLSVHPIAEGTEVRPLFGVFRGRFPVVDALRLALARWLFSSFMRRDVAFMNDMRFRRSSHGPVDPVLHAFLDFLEELPSDPLPELER